MKSIKHPLEINQLNQLNQLPRIHLQGHHQKAIVNLRLTKPRMTKLAKRKETAIKMRSEENKKKKIENLKMNMT